MRLTPCPGRLKELIRQTNSRPPNETDPLRQIARHRKGSKRPFKIVSRNELTINRTDGTIRARDKLLLALSEIEPADRIDRIRECPVCNQIFWAGRADSKACPKHAKTWRKREQRRKTKEREEKKATSRTRRKEKQAEQPFKPSRTAWAIIDAVIRHPLRKWQSIDNHCYTELGQIKSRLTGRIRREGTYRTANVNRCLRMMVERGYLEFYEPDRYYPTEKLKRFVRQWEADWEEKYGPPTH